MNEKKISGWFVIFVVCYCLTAGTALFFAERWGNAVTEAEGYSIELGRIRSERDTLIATTGRLEAENQRARDFAVDIRDGIERLSDASRGRIQTIRDASAQIRAVAETVEVMENRLLEYERFNSGAVDDTDTDSMPVEKKN
jgi:hypothetical protein